MTDTKHIRSSFWLTFVRITLMALMLSVPMMALTSETAWAGPGVPVKDLPDGTCSNSPQYHTPLPAPGDGMISKITDNVQNILANVSQIMFNSITADAGFVDTVRAVLTLYIAIYGILFTFGMVQATMYDFVIRMIKIGIMVALVSPGSWAFFNGTVVRFFNDGTDELINVFSSIAVGGIAVPPGAPPFAVLDDAVSRAVSAKMAITVMGIFATGPYGVIIGLLLIMALGSFMKSMLNALWVYMMSLVLKALLFGIAPLFLCCLLFNRTRHLFDGWLNQIVNASLQPVLLFAFFAFFAKLIEACIKNILETPVCWTEWAESIRGTPFSQHFWRFARWDNNLNTYMPYGGQWSFTGAEGGGPVFPIDLMTVLILLILTELAGRFNHIVIEIAKDLAGAATHLGNFSGGLGEWFSNVGAAGGGLGGGGAGRMLPATGGRAGGARPGPGGIGGPGMDGEMLASTGGPGNVAQARASAAANTGGRGGVA